MGQPGSGSHRVRQHGGSATPGQDPARMRRELGFRLSVGIFCPASQAGPAAGELALPFQILSRNQRVLG